MKAQRARNVSFSNYYLHREAVERTVRQASARRRPRVQIMKGYHCSSDSVNLRALYNVCVCLYVVMCMLYAAYVYTAEVYGGRGTVPLTLVLPARPFAPPDSTVYPTALTVVASHSFLTTILKLHSLSLILTKALGSPISTRTSLQMSAEEKRKEGKGEDQSNFLCAQPFLFFFPLPI